MKKHYRRWAIIAALLVATAIGGRWWARRTLASVLVPHVTVLIESHDSEGIELLADFHPEELRKARPVFLTRMRYTGSAWDKRRERYSYTTEEFPLNTAIRVRDKEITSILCKRGMGLNLPTKQWRRPLAQAIEEDFADGVYLLILHGAEIDLPYIDGRTVLCCVIGKHMDPAIVRLLIDREHGVDLNKRDGYGATALSWAVQAGHIEAVKMLLEADVSVNVIDKGPKTPLDYCKNPKIRTLLRKHGAQTGAELDAAKGGKQ